MRTTIPPRWLSCQNSDPWHACPSPHPGDLHWYIYNVQTGVYVKIGRVQLTGVNYFDRAVEEAERRNTLLQEMQK